MSATDSEETRKSGRLRLGISGRVPSEWVADLRRNQWPAWLGIRRRCARRQFPISGFPKVIDILGHCTGSLFLDISYDYESPDHPYQWNKRDLKALARQWKRAQIMQQSMDSTTKALLDNPSAWEAIFRCWSDLCTAPHEGQT